MFEKFQPWVLKTYGDAAKTKTITMKKAIRIQEGHHICLSKFVSVLVQDKAGHWTLETIDTMI